MLITPISIRHFLSISSTVVLLGLSTIFLARAETTSLSLKAETQSPQSTTVDNQNPYLLSQTWQEGMDLQLDNTHQLSSEVTPQEPIDWDNTKIEIGVDFDLDI